MEQGSSAAFAGRIFWAIVGGFLAGVALRSFFPAGRAFVYFFLLAAAAVFACAGGTLGDRRGMLAAIAFAACALGIARMDAAAIAGDPILSAHLGHQVTIEGVVSAEPDARDADVRIAISAAEVVSPAHEKISVGVLAVLAPHADVEYGERVRAWGTLQAPQAFDTGLGRQFAYPQYLAAQGISYELSRAQAESLDGSWQGNYLQAAAIWIKETFLRGLAATLPEPAAGLAGGITVGDKRSIGPQLSDEFQRVSLIHMVVLSGYNITVVLSAAAKLVRWAPRLAQFGLSTFIVALFILMAGGAGSAARAGLMALVAVLARAAGREFAASRALAFAALAIVAWNPWELCFDPSFQLSALATLGLIAFGPLFDARLRFVPAAFGLREIASSTLATQLAVLPLLLHQNGQFSIYALPANLLALVAVPSAMLFSLVAGIAGICFGSFAIPVALPAYALLSYVIGVARFFASLPLSDLGIGAFGPLWLALAYAVLFAGAWMLHGKKSGRE